MTKKKRGRPPGGLSRQQVVAAALEMIDEIGVEAFSVRGLGQRLGVKDTTVTWHAGSRDQLLVAVVDLVLEEVVPPDVGGSDWRDWLRLMATSYRAALSGHRNAAPLVRDLIMVAPASLHLNAAVLDALHLAGLDGEELIHTHNAFVGYIVGFTGLEFGEPPASIAGRWARTMSERVNALPPGQTRRLLREMLRMAEANREKVSPGHPEDALSASFTIGLEALLAGLSDRLGDGRLRLEETER